MQQSEAINEIVNIFKKEKGFERLFSSFLEKYRSYERIEKGITVKLVNLTLTERSAIGGLFGEDFSGRNQVSISAEKFERKLKETSRFADHIQDVTLLTIIEAYYGETLQSKRVEQEQFLQERSLFFGEYRLTSSSVAFLKLLGWIETEGNQSNRFFQLYKQNAEELSEIMDTLRKVFEQWPLKDYIYLPIFAAKVTGNPHAFDLKTQLGNIFIYTLQVLKTFEACEIVADYETNTEEVTELLFEFRIVRDDVLNFVTVYQMMACNLNGEENFLFSGALRERAIVHVPLKEVAKLSNVRGVTPGNVLFVVENSGMLSHLINFIEEKGVSVSFVCGNGQLNLATLRFLDLFAQSGGTIYYSGDFDPEGLQIAQKLLHRFPGAVKMLCCTTAACVASLSMEVMSSRRLNMLESIVHEELLEVKQVMKLQNKIGYQENILELICDEVLRISGSEK